MKTEIFLIFICIILSVITYILYKSILKLKSESKKEINRRIVILVIFIVSIIFIILGIIGNNNEIEISNKSSNLIAASTALLTGLAFFVQYLANKQVQKQFKFQQFESHIYKLVDIHRENVLNWKKQDKKTFEIYYDRLAAVSVLDCFDVLFKEITLFIDSWVLKNNSYFKDAYIKELYSIYTTFDDKEIKNEDFIFWIKTELTYIVLFYGLEDKGIENIKNLYKDKLEDNFITELVNLFSRKISQKNHKQENSYSVHFYISKPNSSDVNNYELKNILKDTDLYNLFVSDFLHDSPDNFKYYNGVETMFSHYYRHLFNSYKFINTYFEIDYLTRWKTYGNLIRTQLTNTEQILFFLNSISLIGRDWELNHQTSLFMPDEKILNKKLITKYDIIKNIPEGDRKKYNIDFFYPDIEWEDKPMYLAENKSRYTTRTNLKKYYN